MCGWMNGMNGIQKRKIVGKTKQSQREEYIWEQVEDLNPEQSKGKIQKNKKKMMKQNEMAHKCKASTYLLFHWRVHKSLTYI